ncbi:MAG: glycosyltransferase family 39 protein [Caldilineaceae bacterium]|nr:glycosyltransferase family 39 protein [Caldilineaceae bacterium]
MRLQSARITSLLLLIVALLGHILLANGLPNVVRALGACIIGVLVPGTALTLLVWSNAPVRPTKLELGLLSLGAGFSFSVLLLLGLSYAPGPLTGRMTLIALDGVTLALLALLALRRDTRSGADEDILLPQWVLPALFLIILAASAFRLINLGYAEFHGDESRAVLRAAGVIQGYEETLFLHKKGPGEILIPLLHFSLAGPIDEGAARLPFALAGIAMLAAVGVLGVRLFGPIAGLTAALLLTFDGYLVAFAHFVQYQSVVLLLTSLAVLLLVFAYRRPQVLARALVFAALLMATALLFHYDAAAALIPLALIWLKIGLDGRVRWPILLRATTPAAVLGALALALFYVPYALHPHFQATRTYLIGSRIGPDSFPHNNIQAIFLRTSLYSSAYYVLLMLALLAGAAYLALGRGRRFRTATGITMGALLFLLPLPFIPAGPWLNVYLLTGLAALFLLIWTAPHLDAPTRLLWLWLGLLLLAAFFFIATPKTHVYVVLMPWALLAGGATEAGWRKVAHESSRRVWAIAGAVAILLFAASSGRYITRLYVQHTPETLLQWDEETLPAYWMPFTLPESDSLYGFPFTNGWKVVNELYAQGVIEGDYDTNQWFEWIPDWYVRDQHRCAATATWYFAIDNPEPWAERSRAIADRLVSQGYRPWGQVIVEGQPGMTIYRQGGNAEEALRILPLEEYAPAFDATAGPDLPLAYPVIEPTVAMPLGVNFSDLITLEGYALEGDAPLRPGDTVRLHLYWRARQANLPAYKVTVQAYDANGLKAVQQDRYSVCDRLPASEWPPGELIEDIYDLEIREEIPDGVYPLYVGLYVEETLERLPVTDGSGVMLDDKALLTDLTVSAAE